MFALGLLVPSAAPPQASALSGIPGLVLWAWERPEDLRGLPADTGVAFLAQTITIGPRGSESSPRRQPLRVSAGTPLIAVTRVETRADHPALTGDLAVQVARDIARTATLPGVTAVQVDFDAVRSERIFYRQLLQSLRSALDAATPLSITALASWCMDDQWLDGLPVDEVVPMLFQMGPAEQHRQSAAAAGGLRGAACRDALGLSLDEPVALRAQGRRVYIFSPARWTQPLVAEARRRAVR